MAEANPNESLWMGFGSPKPQPRVKQNSMFGHVRDAFDEKSIVKIGEVTPYEKRMKAQQEAEKAKEAELARDAEVAKKGSSTDASPSATDAASIEAGVDSMKISDSGAANIPAETVPQFDGSGLLIKGGRLVNDDQSITADVYIHGNKIQMVGEHLTVPNGTRVVDALGKLVIPGGIDMSTHFQMPFMCTSSADDFYTGSRAALAGGTTTIVDCVVPEKGQSLLEAYDRWRGYADDSVCCSYVLRVAVTWWSEQVASEMETLAKEKGVNTFLMSTSSEFGQLDDKELYQAFKKCKQLGCLAQVHAENGSIIVQRSQEIVSEGITGPEGHLLSRPEEVEAEAVNRAITLANQAGSPLYVTKVTGRAAADVIARNRRKGKVVFGEPTVASLAVDGSNIFDKNWRHAAAFLTSPPLRPHPQTAMHLVDLLSNGDLQLVSSDHCTFNANQKALGKDDFRRIPPGVNGVAERMSVLWEKAVVSGKMDPCRFVSVVSTTPAKLLNLYPNKGRIAVGSDADLVVWDPEAVETISTQTQHNRCDFNIFEGMECHGKPIFVVRGGEAVLDGDGLHETKGSGCYLSTSCNSEFAYGKIWAREKVSAPRPVQRDPYNGVGAVDRRSNERSPQPSGAQTVEPFCRPPTKSGGRNMQDTTFTISGDGNKSCADDPILIKKGGGYRVNQPPGGQTTQLW